MTRPMDDIKCLDCEDSIDSHTFEGRCLSDDDQACPCTNTPSDIAWYLIEETQREAYADGYTEGKNDAAKDILTRVTKAIHERNKEDRG